LARFACTSFCGAGAGEEQPANSATKIAIDVTVFILILHIFSV
jgi:hypothetical protein